MIHAKDHKQSYLFDPWDYLGPKRRMLMEESWAGLFIQYSLFDNPVQAQKIKTLYNVADELGEKFGKHTVHLGSTHLIEKMGRGRRGLPTVREQTILKGETSRRHLGLPLIHIKTEVN